MPDYAAEFAQKIRSQPLRHRLRVASFNFLSTLSTLHYRFSPGSNRTDTIVVDPRLKPPTYRYRNLRGPWIERAFFRYWSQFALDNNPSHYLPIFFDSIFFHAQVHKYTPSQFDSIQKLLRQTLDKIDPSLPCFTVLGMYDFPIWDWHLFPDNVVVYSAAGGGDIPIPLLSGDRPFRSDPKDLLISFMGSLDGASNAGGVRRRMADALRDFAYFGQGPDWEKVMGRSTFSLCPRGQAPASFRLFEAMSLGSIPIYIWEGVEWLPYQDELDWSKFSISIHVDHVEQLPSIIGQLTASRIAEMQQYIAEIFPKYFTIRATSQYILRHSQSLRALEAVHKITSRRFT